MLTPHIQVGIHNLPVWPEDQSLAPLDEGAVFFKTDFADHELFAPALKDAIERLREDPEVKSQYSQALGGTKIYRLEQWLDPAAQLINARAVEAFKRAVKAETGAIDMGWANLYGYGDYSVAHAHIRCTGSVVYMVDGGDQDDDDQFGGRFSIIDPRFPPCCKVASGYMTNPFCPILKPGSMIVFPSALVHSVNPYHGQRPRITLAWNMNEKPLQGDTLSMINQEAPPA
ncbi:MAG: putative 2OG-Fe(II) oxygenase [Pseudomonadota bacterium]